MECSLWSPEERRHDPYASINLLFRFGRYDLSRERRVNREQAGRLATEPKERNPAQTAQASSAAAKAGRERKVESSYTLSLSIPPLCPLRSSLPVAWPAIFFLAQADENAPETCPRSTRLSSSTRCAVLGSPGPALGTVQRSSADPPPLAYPGE